MEVKKVKNKKGIVTVEYENITTVGDEVYTNKKTEENSVEPHPDFNKALNDLVPYVLDVFYWSDKAEAMQGLISIAGITISGKDDKQGVVIQSTLETSTEGRPVSINTPGIKFSEPVYGWEKELEEIVRAIQDEAEQYLNGKKAQQQVYDAIEQENTDK